MNRIFSNYSQIPANKGQDGYRIGNKNKMIKTNDLNQREKNFSNQILAGHSDELLPYLTTVFLESEKFIYQSGEQINEIYFPENAVISELQMLEDGRTSELAMIGKEGLTGLEVVLNSGKSSHWMRVSVSGSALKMKAEIFKREFDGNAEFRKVVLDYLHKYFEQTAKKAICNCYHLIENRLCSWLLMLGDRSGKDKITVTQEQLAHFIGVQRPTITHIVQDLRNQQIIGYKRGEINIFDREKLLNAACSCYASIDDDF